MNTRPISALLVDKSMRITFINTEYCKNFLYTSKDELVDTNFKSIIHPKDHYKLREIIDVLNNNRKSSAMNINTANIEKRFELRMYDNNLKVEA